MKTLLVVTIVLFGGMVVYWLTMTSPKEKPGIDIPVAFGKPGAGQIEMHAVIGVVLANKSRRNEGLVPGKPVDWNGWVQAHCLLRDAAGQPVAVRKQGNSGIVKPLDVQKTVGTEEFFVAASVNPGAAYTFDYVIDQPQPTTYRWRFTAPTEARPLATFRFEQQ